MIPEDQIEQKVTAMFATYAQGQSEIKYWPMWGRYNWEEHEKERIARKYEHINLNFDENTWFVNDMNRDMVWTYDELLAGQSGMTHDEAGEIYDLFGKDPFYESLFYDEVKAKATQSVVDQLECKLFAFSRPLDEISIEDPEVTNCLDV